MPKQYAVQTEQETENYEEWEEEEEPIDWNIWGLGLTAAFLLIGLIPFWFYIYITLKP